MGRLPSGLTVAVRPLPDATVTSAHLWFDTGAVDEAHDQAGAAHFVEHLLFKGTEQRGIGAAAAQIEGLGGDLNAWTSWDETVLHATLAGDSVDDALDVLFDMARASLFDPDELERERLVILEEMRGYQHDPDTVVADRLQARLFGDHPYGRPVIGTEATVRGLSHSDLLAFWHQNYHPGRAVLGVAGPVDPAGIFAAAEPRSSGWALGARRSSIASPARRPGGHEHLRRDFGAVVVAFGWPGPAVGHADEAAVDVLVYALGEGAAARLPVRLDLEAGVASNVWADAEHWRAGGRIALGFSAGDTEHAVDIALREVGAVARHGLLPAELDRARDGMLADLWFAEESTHGIASELVWAVARTGHPDALDAYRAALSRVTPDDVRRAARHWLDPAQAQLVVLDRGLPRGALERVLRSVPTPAAVPRRRAGDLGDASVHRLGALRVAVLPDRGRVAAVRVLGRGGQLLETPRTAGLAEAWERTVARAAGGLDPRGLAAEADALSLRLDTGAGRTSQGLGASFPAHRLEASLGLLGQVLLEPWFAAEDWHHVRHAILDDLAAVGDDADTVAHEALWRGLWPKHPFRLAAMGTPSSIEALTPTRLRSLHHATMTADNLVVAVAGGVDVDEVLRALEPWAEALPPVAAPWPEPIADPPGRTPRSRSAGSGHAIVVLGVRGVGTHHPDRLALAVAAQLLDSQAGRLFLELREARGLAYNVWASSAVTVAGGVFSVGLATDPARVSEAARALRSELLGLAHSGPSEAELQRTTQMMLGLTTMRHQRVTTRVSSLANAVLDGLGFGLPRLRGQLAEVRPAHVRDALQRLDLEDLLRITVVPAR